MMMAREGASLATLLVALAVAASSCLAELPPAAVCPGAPAQAGGDCSADLQALDAANQACTNATRVPTVRCLGADGCEPCVAESVGCFPAPACPPALEKAMNGAARCARLASEDDAAPKSCRPCARDSCATLCDGRGPVFAYAGAAIKVTANGPLLVSGSGAPPAGAKYGVYARLRGSGRVRLIARAAGSQGVDVEEPVESTDFVEKWRMSDTASTGDALSVGIAPVAGSAAIVEIDCIVPFWVGP